MQKEKKKIIKDNTEKCCYKPFPALNRWCIAPETTMEKCDKNQLLGNPEDEEANTRIGEKEGIRISISASNENESKCTLNNSAVSSSLRLLLFYPYNIL